MAWENCNAGCTPDLHAHFEDPRLRVRPWRQSLKPFLLVTQGPSACTERSAACTNGGIGSEREPTKVCAARRQVRQVRQPTQHGCHGRIFDVGDVPFVNNVIVVPQQRQRLVADVQLLQVGERPLRPI